MNRSNAIAPPHVLDASQLTRDDLASVLSEYERESKRLNSRGALGMLGGVIVALVLLGVNQMLATSDDWIPLISLTIYGTVLGSMALEWWYRRRMIERLQIECGSCGQPFLKGGTSKEVIRRAELIIATGRCARCGHSFVDNQA